MEAVDKISVGVSKEKAGQNTQEAITENADGMKVSLGEKICYGVGDIGANLVWTTVASFLTIYCTDVAGIAAGVVGTLMLIARLFDGVSDLFMGIIIDKPNTRWGKARPWVLWSAPPLGISLIMIFPIIAAVTMCISQVLSTKMSGQQAQMQGSMKVMMWGMNIMFVFMCFQMPVGFSLYYGTSNIFMMLQTVLTYKVYNPEKFKAQYEAEVAAKRAAKKEIKTVTVEEGGKKVEKNVNKRQLDQMRLEYARKLDAEKYANDRTVPLTDEQRAEMEAQKGKKKK